MIINSHASHYKGKAGSLSEKSKLTQRETRDKDDAFQPLVPLSLRSRGTSPTSSLLFNYFFDYI